MSASAVHLFDEKRVSMNFIAEVSELSRISVSWQFAGLITQNILVYSFNHGGVD